MASSAADLLAQRGDVWDSGKVVSSRGFNVEYDGKPLESFGEYWWTVRVWDDCPDNISNLFEQGDKAAVDDAFKHAHHVTRQRFVISRILPTAMEPRGCIGAYDRYEDRHTIYCAVGNIHAVRGLLAGDVFGVPENQFHVICGDIGGAFGSKGVTAPENIISLYASKKLGRPVKWIAERSESLMSDEQARDSVIEAELAAEEGPEDDDRDQGLRPMVPAESAALVEDTVGRVEPLAANDTDETESPSGPETSEGEPLAESGTNEAVPTVPQTG